MLLAEQIEFGLVRGHFLQSAMDPFMPAVLLRMAGHDSLETDSKLQPPQRKFGQSSGS